MKLELRDRNSSRSLFISAEGQVIGREGGDAQVKLSDKGVSKRHARIWADGQAWYIEDLNSSNGTWVDQQQVTQPAELVAGQTIVISRQEFEVVGVLQDDGRRTLDGDGDEVEAVPRPSGRPPPRSGDRPAPRGGAAAADQGGDRVDGAGSGASPVAKGVPPRPVVEKRRDPTPRKPSPVSETAEAKGVGYFFVAVPKAIGYYLLSVPLLLVNPVGTIRKGIDEQEHEPKAWLELIAYALPPLFLVLAAGALAALVAQIVGHVFSVGGLISAFLVPLVSTVIGAAIAGFVFHPVLEWIVEKLQGSSDERSRTNYFLAIMTATALTAVPTLLSAVVALIPVPFINLLPGLVAVAANLLVVFVSYSWLKHFGVFKWFQLLVVIGGLAACAMGILGFVTGVIGTIRSFGSGTPAVVATTPGTTDDPAKVPDDVKAQADAAIKAAQAAAAGNPEALKALEAARKQAEEAAKLAQAKGPGTVEEVPPKTPPGGKQPVAPTPAPTPAMPPTVAASPTPVPAGAVVTMAAAEPTSTAIAAAALAAPKGSYRAWHLKLQAIEKAIGDDPTLLNSVSGVLALYKDLQTARYRVERSREKADGKRPSEGKVNARLAEIDEFQRTGPIVENLFRLLFK